MKKLLTLISLLWITGTLLAQGNIPYVYNATYHQPSGNRFVLGQGTFPNVTVHDMQLDSPIAWLANSNAEFDPPWPTPLWLATTSDGRARYIGFVDGQLDTISVLDTGYPASRPPFFYMDDTSQPWLLDFGGSPLSHPVAALGGWVYLTPSGAIDMQSLGLDTPDLPLNALPDARIVANDAQQVAIYSGANDQRYTHGVLGNSIEATELSILELVDLELQVVARVTLPEPDVFEGLSPMWADVDQDGVEDLITTVSNAQVGAQLRVYRVDGSLLAASDPIGLGGRWRHQLAFAAFSPNGEFELVDVRTPHIGGIVEFFQLQGQRLEIVASLPGYTSHVIGTRNLDMAVAGDFNGDGQPEIVLPLQDRSGLAGLQHGPGGVEEVWRLPLDGTLSSNLSAVTLPDGRLALAAGTDKARLRIWMPAG